MGKKAESTVAPGRRKLIKHSARRVGFLDRQRGTLVAVLAHLAEKAGARRDMSDTNGV